MTLQASPGVFSPPLPDAVDVPSRLPLQIWAIPATPDAVVSAVGTIDDLDEAERAELTQIRSPEDADLYLVSHIALRRVLAARLEVEPRDIAYRREPCAGCSGPHGRPVLDGTSSLHFSLARTRATGTAGLALIALASTPVGIDAEARSDHADDADLEDLIACLHERERATLRRFSGEARTAAFLDCWVRKEAYLKATGRGLALGVSSFWVGLGPEHGEPETADQGPPSWPVAPLAVPGGIPAAVCLRM